MRWTLWLLALAGWWFGSTQAVHGAEPIVQLGEPQCRAAAVRVAEALRASDLWMRDGPPEQLVVESSALSTALADLLTREMARALGVNLPRSETPTVDNHVAIRLRAAGATGSRRVAVDVFWRGEIGGPPLWTFTHLVPLSGPRQPAASPSAPAAVASTPATPAPPDTQAPRGARTSPTRRQTAAAPPGQADPEPVVVTPGSLPPASGRVQFETPRPGYWPGATGVVYTLDSSLNGKFQVVAQQGGQQGGAFVATVRLTSTASRPLRVRHFVTALDEHGRYVDESPRQISVVPPGGELVLTHSTSEPGAALYAAVIDLAK